MAKSKTLALTWDNLPEIGLRVLTSFGLASGVLALLTLVTLLGTLNQIEEGLIDSTAKYFESAWIIDTIPIGKVTIPVFLPGGYLLLAILFFNILAGTIVKIRRNWKAIGLYVSHIGILILIFSSFVTRHFAWEGNMALRPGMQSSEALHYRNWQIEILPVNAQGEASKALIIPHGDLETIGWKGQRTFTSPDLPFDVRIRHAARNATPIPISAPMAAKSDTPAVDGFKLLELPKEKEAERNSAGFYAEFLPKNGEPPIPAILWAHLGGNFAEVKPFTLRTDGKTFAVQVVRERMAIPFTIKLDQFLFEKYAGVMTAKNYQSNITKLEDGREEKIEVKMNEPFRHRGYTFFQASFGPPNAGPDDELYTVFTVWKNPSDHWPLFSLLITFAGLLTHMGWKLADHLRRSTRTA
ncbi:MAG: Cytochrome c biogenesis protein ResB [Verrucomicrobia bacterium]|nr:MAG: Cytochrome c biogenesis protein ResB [Verrucomicrobiota bacterium]